MARLHIGYIGYAECVASIYFSLIFQTSSNSTTESSSDGPFPWESDLQGYILSSFFYGYVITQIPFGLLSKKYGSIYFLGVGMLINSVFGLLVPIAAYQSIWWLAAVRFIQGLGEVSKATQQVQSEGCARGVNVWWALTFVPCIGFQWKFLVRALLYHARTLCWLSGFHPMKEVEWVHSFMQV